MSDVNDPTLADVMREVKRLADAVAPLLAPHPEGHGYDPVDRRWRPPNEWRDFMRYHGEKGQLTAADLDRLDRTRD